MRGIWMAEKESKYSYKKKPAWEIFNKDQIKEAFDFAEEYKKFLNESKTERNCKKNKRSCRKK